MYAVKPGTRPVTESTLGLWTMIAIAVCVILVIVVVIDVSCYFMSGCGITMCICVRLCDRQPADADDTAELKETNKKNNDVEAPPTVLTHAPAAGHRDDRYHQSINQSINIQKNTATRSVTKTFAIFE